jgi:hypothetical protein
MYSLVKFEVVDGHDGHFLLLILKKSKSRILLFESLATIGDLNYIMNMHIKNSQTPEIISYCGFG